MITVINKGEVVTLVEKEGISLSISGKQLIQLNQDLTIPAHTKVQFDTQLYVDITDLLDECIVSEYIEGEDSPLYVVCEPYEMNWPKDDPIIISIYNSSDEDYTFKKDTIIASLARYHKCNCDETSDAFKIGALGQQIIYDNGEIKVIGDTNIDYYYETIFESNGNSYVTIKKR